MSDHSFWDRFRKPGGDVMRLVTATEMQAIDQRTIEGGHVPSATLMEQAGHAALEVALELLGGIRGARVEIVCGKGNNGGDGLVLARLLVEQEMRVRVHLTHPASRLSPDARHNHDQLPPSVRTRILGDDLADPGPLEDPRQRPRAGKPGPLAGTVVSELVRDLSRADLCVDALLGTGVRSTIEGRLAALINTINWASPRTLALDIPSGIDGNTGAVCGTSIWADRTVTFGLPKLGLVLFPGRERAGRLHVVDIGFPDSVVRALASKRHWVDRQTAAGFLPRLDPTAHKYERGCVVVIAGSRRYPGAAALVAEATLRSGAGIVYLVVPEGIQTLLQSKLTEVIVEGVPETPEGTIAPEAERLVAPLLQRATALAVGSGLGASEPTRGWLGSLLAVFTKPAVIDADGLEAIPKPPHAGARVATPHVGELARWLGQPVSQVRSSRMDVAREAASQRKLVLVAKGAPTFVASPEGEVFVNGSGHVGLATAGSGDVLTGVVAAQLAQGIAPTQGAALAVYLHGRAADLASHRYSQRSLLARDLLDHLPLALKDLESP